MIKINLLPPVERKKKVRRLPALPWALILGIVVSIVAGLLLGLFTFHLRGKVKTLKDEVAFREKRLNELKAMIKEVGNYEKDNKAFQDKNSIIERLKRNQDVPVRLLDEVSLRLPKGVWLTSLHESGGNTNIEGFAFTNSDLVGYVENLKGSKHLEDVTLIESRHTVVENVSVYQFRMTFRIKV